MYKDTQTHFIKRHKSKKINGQIKCSRMCIINNDSVHHDLIRCVCLLTVRHIEETSTQFQQDQISWIFYLYMAIHYNISQMRKAGSIQLHQMTSGFLETGPQGWRGKKGLVKELKKSSFNRQ